MQEEALLILDIKKVLIKSRGRRVEFKGVMLNKAKNTTVNIRGLIYHENV